LLFKNKNDKIDLTKLQNILKNPNVKGIVNTDIIINGQLSNPNYSLNISSSEVSIKNFKINDIVLNLAGDKEKANVNKLSLDVYKNLIVGSGNYDIKNKTYKAKYRKLQKSLECKMRLIGEIKSIPKKIIIISDALKNYNEELLVSLSVLIP